MFAFIFNCHHKLDLDLAVTLIDPFGSIMNQQHACSHMATGSLTYFQSIAKPFGQPRVVLTMDRACDPSAQALIILAGRYQSVQKIYLSDKKIKGNANSIENIIVNSLKHPLYVMTKSLIQIEIKFSGFSF